MARIKYRIYDSFINEILKGLIDAKIVSGYNDGKNTIVATYGVNKTTLKKLLEKSK